MVGVHLVGDRTPEIIQMAAIAVKMGVTKPQRGTWTCAVHPTLAEELKLRGHARSAAPVRSRRVG
ncbi:hypothetical protein ACRAWD_09795 [Caulobacter segnis]